MTGSTPLRRIIVASTRADKTRGLLYAEGLRVPCALGHAGIAQHKREGDGATPRGRLGLLAVFYRTDRLRRPMTRLPASPLDPGAGWCDDPRHRRYNRAVRLPFAGRHERLWRSDRLYDVVVVLSYNLAHPVPGAGSAIFLHVAAPEMTPTEGCVAVRLPAMRRILARAGPGTYLDIR